MIGYYIHHVGRGHLHRAFAVADALDDVVVGLSSLAKPPWWPHGWVRLPLDTDGEAVDPDAGGLLHWAPLGHRGLSARMAAIAQWIADDAPSMMIVDVSIEVITLARLCGVRVATMVLPGRRHDRAHRLGFDLADTIIAPWPHHAPGLLTTSVGAAHKLHHVGAISRFADRADFSLPRASETIVYLGGTGGPSNISLPVTVSGHPVITLSESAGSWMDDPWPLLCQARVVVCHAGLGSIADVATAGRPAIVVPAARPHAEQAHTARALGDAKLAVVIEGVDDRTDWASLVEAATELGGQRWGEWLTGGGARTAAALIRSATADSR